MNELYLFLGISVLFLVAVDLLWTTIWVDGGGGPLSRRMGKMCWFILRKVSTKHFNLLRLAGPVVLSLTLISWILLLWVGWTLVFSADAGSILLTPDMTPVTSWMERVYYVGFTLFTLGIGDYVPQKGIWQLVTTVATGSGMLFITLSVSYVVSVLSGVVQKRSFAKNVTGQGTNWVSLVKQSWNGQNFHSIDFLLKDLSSQLSILTQQHKAYPILHYYHSEKNSESSAVALAILDEALTVYEYGVEDEYKPNKVWMKQARSSVNDYMETLHKVFFKPAIQTPPPMKLEFLRDEGLPVKPNQEFNIAESNLVKRRERLLGLVEADAQMWPKEKEN
ncbi:two pore domain potassium channel family protein [Rossellomorea vietnamensis]|uniref:Two pore domain potassium channel family protein n=1 Tax=Rossellomorea vietnamensis TaxID=218284 RepID=A0A5D4MJ35_9BACI|nr:ion channel [Rossellomorea vietnamensis]TYS01399.1 two pore domain potassium channel family protein [Rossellomorea vietnamensis]